MTDLTFANNFWGRDDAGVDQLLQRMHDAKQTCEEIHNYFKERMTIEEDYAKRMLALSRKKLGSAETGNLKQALEVIRSSTESMGKSHTTCYKQIKSQLGDPLETFAASLRSRRKTTESTVEKLTKAKQLQNAAVEKARSKFEMDCNKINGYSAQQNLLMGKELEKNNLKLDKVHSTVDNSKREYQTSLRVLAETIDQWNKEWKLSCDKFQDLEEERINFLKSNLWAYTNIVSTVCVGDDEVCETIRVALEKCDVQQDIEAFVKARGTGSEILDPPEFINFLGGYSRDSTNDQYRVANFSRDVTEDIPSLDVPADSYNRSSQSSPLHGSATSASSSVYTNSVSSASTDNDYDEARQSFDDSSAQSKRRSWASPFSRKKKETASPTKSSSRQSFADVDSSIVDEEGNYSAVTLTSKSPFAQRFVNSSVGSTSNSRPSSRQTADSPSRNRPSSRQAMTASPTRNAIETTSSTNGHANAVLSMGDNMFDLDDNVSRRSPHPVSSPSSSPKKNLARDDPLVAALERLRMASPNDSPNGGSSRATPGGMERPSSRGLAVPQPAFTSEEMEATSSRYSNQTNELFSGDQQQQQQKARPRQMGRPKSSVELGGHRDRHYEDNLGDARQPDQTPNSSQRQQPQLQQFDYYDPYHSRPKSASPHKDIYGAFESNPYGRSPSPNPYDRSAAQGRAPSPSPGRASPSAVARAASPSPYGANQQRPSQRGPAQQMRPRSKSNVDLSVSAMGDRPKSTQASRPQSRGGNRLPPTSSDGRRVIRHARAAYDYRAAIPEEVSFRKGDVLLVVHMQEDGWWEVEVLGYGRFGLAPSNFLVSVQ